jgi:hypothetical protein
MKPQHSMIESMSIGAGKTRQMRAANARRSLQSGSNASSHATCQRHGMRNVLIAILVMLGCSCATPHVLRLGAVPASVAPTAAEQRVIVWQRAIDVLLQDGYVPQVLNETACYIFAKHRDDLEAGVLAGASAIVTVSPEGLLRVEVAGNGLYTSDAALAHDVAQEQTHIFDQIRAGSAAPAPGAS